MLRQSEFFCFVVSKTESKDPGVLLFFCVGIPGAGAGRDQAWLSLELLVWAGGWGWRDLCQPYQGTGCRSGDDDEDPVP